LAQRLGQCSIAERVELEVQKHYLLFHGCDRTQGYLVDRLLDEEAAVEFLAINDRQY
jgi:EAL domain-containing protein (putative c-di-GMP-specific phosphodiesterase class I)